MPPSARTTWGKEVLMIVASKATTTAEAAMPDIARRRSLREAESGDEERGCMDLETKYSSKSL
jgi:hypothetical protein